MASSAKQRKTELARRSSGDTRVQMMQIHLLNQLNQRQLELERRINWLQIHLLSQQVQRLQQAPSQPAVQPGQHPVPNAEEQRPTPTLAPLAAAPVFEPEPPTAPTTSQPRETTSEVLLAPLPPGATSHFFLSHAQATGADQVGQLALELEKLGFISWLDNRANDLTKAG